MAISMRKMRERLNQLEAEHARLGALVEHYRLVIADLEAMDDGDTSYSPSTNMKDVMEQILIGEGKPLHYREIYNRLVASGIRVNGEDPVRNTGAHLSSDIRFESLGSGMWGLAQWSRDQSQPGQSGPIAADLETDDGTVRGLHNTRVSLAYDDLVDDSDDLPF